MSLRDYTSEQLHDELVRRADIEIALEHKVAPWVECGFCGGDMEAIVPKRRHLIPPKSTGEWVICADCGAVQPVEVGK